VDVTAPAFVLRDRMGHRERWMPILAVLAVLAMLKVTTSVFGITGAVVGVLATAGVLAVVARRGRATLHDLGLSRQALRRGALWSLAFGAVFAAGFGATAVVARVVPAVATWVQSLQVAAPNWDMIALQAFVTIPLGTVLIEEVAFRGALPALLGRAGASTRRAVVISALLFGMWHIAPSVSAGVGSGAAPASVLIAVLGTVVFTTASGLGLGWLRHRSRSLLPPMVVHLATNSLGLGLLWVVTLA
jgi:membrane protease YdiL (CAAX protease family)